MAKKFNTFRPFGFTKIPLIYILLTLIMGGIFFGQSYGNSASHDNNKNNSNTMNLNQSKPLVTIVQLVEHPALNATRQGIIDTLKTNNPDIKIEIESAQGNAALAAQIAEKFLSKNPNIMVGIPTTVSQALVAANKKANIPIVFSSVTDPLGAGLVKNLNKPDNNVTGVSNFISSKEQFEFFKNVLPKLKTIGVIYNPGEANSVVLVNEMKKLAPEYNLKIVAVAANSSSQVPDAARKLASNVDAIFINNDNTALSAIDAIIKIATSANMPVLSSDTDTIKNGALIALGPNQYEIGQQTGKLIIAILAGQAVSDMAVQFPFKTEIVINQKKANELGISFSKETLEKAHKLVK